MFKQYLEQITDVGIYPMFSLLVFFVFFTALIVYVVKANKEELNEISRLPLSNDETNNA
ncbi:MAG: CcoQ/FixQ family Cbb3-type cytochrome c oxidase assembly chaperone [Bacteroidota bacterium]|jgi:cbb3-type cytochrome oxidase subunit 3